MGREAESPALVLLSRVQRDWGPYCHEYGGLAGRPWLTGDVIEAGEVSWKGFRVQGFGFREHIEARAEA